jgi:hypothetical protein
MPFGNRSVNGSKKSTPAACLLLDGFPLTAHRGSTRFRQRNSAQRHKAVSRANAIYYLRLPYHAARNAVEAGERFQFSGR